MAVGPISDFGTFPSSMRIIVFRRELLTIDPLDLLRVFRDGFFARAALCLASAQSFRDQGLRQQALEPSDYPAVLDIHGQPPSVLINPPIRTFSGLVR